MFETFKKELFAHRDGRYHHLAGPLERRSVETWFENHDLTPPRPYVDFLSEIGPGIFFGGSFSVYPLSHANSRSVDSELSRLRRLSKEAVFPIGYDGTTELCYCLDGASGEDTVYWFSWEEKIKRSLSVKFAEWVNAKPKELFNDAIYTGYKKLTNVDELVAVMEERAAFSVMLLRFERQLQKPPDKPDDKLRRYNKVTLEIIKSREVTIPVLTFKVIRLGSKIGEANVEYATIPVEDISINVPTIRECYVFDPFNLPFTDIEVKFNPVIDLGSKMRVRFKEISSLLH